MSRGIKLIVAAALAAAVAAPAASAGKGHPANAGWKSHTANAGWKSTHPGRSFMHPFISKVGGLDV